MLACRANKVVGKATCEQRGLGYHENHGEWKPHAMPALPTNYYVLLVAGRVEEPDARWLRVIAALVRRQGASDCQHAGG